MHFSYKAVANKNDNKLDYLHLIKTKVKPRVDYVYYTCVMLTCVSTEKLIAKINLKGIFLNSERRLRLKKKYIYVMKTESKYYFQFPIFQLCTDEKTCRVQGAFH